MSATRTLAVSSGLGALFLLHGCGEKSVSDGAAPVDADTPPPVAPTDVSTTNPDEPAAPDSGSWSDVTAEAESRISKNEMREFMKKIFNKKVEVFASPDGNIFPAHSSKNTVSVVLNDHNSAFPGNQKTMEDIKEAFTPKDRDTAEINLIKFKNFHTIVEDRDHIYVADPAIIDEGFKMTQAVFFKLPYHGKQNWWIRSDEDKKRSQLKETMGETDTQATSMVVVFTGEKAELFPYRNRNNFAMAVINPKDISSPKDVFMSSLDTFDILLTVISAAQKMSSEKEDSYEMIDNFKQAKKTAKDLELNWWGCYAEVRNNETTEMIATKLVGGQSPAFGKSIHNDDEAEAKLKLITETFTKFFAFKKQFDSSRSSKPSVNHRTDRRDEGLELSNGRYAGACKLTEEIREYNEALEALNAIENEADKKKKIESLNDKFDQHCVPHERHENSWYWRARSACNVGEKFHYDTIIRCANDDKICLGRAITQIKQADPYKNTKMKRALHEIAYTDHFDYAFAVHRIQTAILQFLQDYEDEDLKGKARYDEEVVTKNLTEHDLLAPKTDYLKNAVITYPFKMGQRQELFQLTQAKDGTDLTMPYQNTLTRIARGAPTSWFCARNPQGEENAGISFSAQLKLTNEQIENQSRPIQVWEPLFAFLGQYDDDVKVSEIVPEDKKTWEEKFHKKRDVKINEDITFTWPEYKFPSQGSLSSAQIQRIYIGEQSDKAEINAAVYAGLAVQFWKQIDREDVKAPDFYAAVKDKTSARKENDNLKSGEFRMKGVHQKNKADRIPQIVLAGAGWSDAKAKVDVWFSEKKDKSSMDAGF